MPTVSVVVPVYNVKDYLPACVNSLLAQSFADFEALLVDDGSTDGGGALCDELAAANGRIRVLHQANAGLSAARNNAIAIAKGKYIACLDGDDYVLENWLQNMVRAIEESGADMVKTGYYRVPDHDADFEPPREARLLPDGSVQIALKAETLDGAGLLRRMAENHSLNMACMQLVKTELAQRYPYPLNRLCEDMTQLMELCCELKKVVCISECGYCWVIRGGSITNAADVRLGVHNMQNYRRLTELLLQNGETQSAAKAAQMSVIQLFYGPFGVKNIQDAAVRADGETVWEFLNTQARALPYLDGVPRTVRLQARLYRLSPALYRAAAGVVRRVRG